MALRHGKFEFRNDDSLELSFCDEDFIFVPRGYDFEAKDSIVDIFKALDTDFPDFIFHFGFNNGPTPYNEMSQDEKLKERNNERWIQEVLSTIPNEGVMFLIARPYGGNVLSRIATHAAIKTKTRRLALLCCEPEPDEDHEITERQKFERKSNYMRRMVKKEDSTKEGESKYEKDEMEFLKYKHFKDRIVPIGDEIKDSVTEGFLGKTAEKNAFGKVTVLVAYD